MFYAERSIATTPAAETILSRHPDLEWIDDYRSFRAGTVHREKQAVIYAVKRGPWLKPFRCYAAPAFDYLSLNLAEGCPFNCVYCYLQTYSEHAAVVVFVNLQTLAGELSSLQANRERRLWISSGLLTDSLVAERHLPAAGWVSRQIPLGSVFELRTKACDIELLQDRGIDRSRVVVSWSLNPPAIARTYEYGAPPVEDRLQAAVETVRQGYRVAFHFDPVFCHARYRADYEALLERVRVLFTPESMAFVSLGLFRYMPALGMAIRGRFPYHEILTGEFFPDRDGKYHYLRALRKEMYGCFSLWLRPWKGRVPVFLAMEPDTKPAESFF
jgi:spore photoproduct lyase